MTLPRIAAIGFAIALITSGCTCRKSGGTTARKGEVGVIYNVDGVSETSRDAVYDFGAVFMGQEQKLTLTVRNMGLGSLGLETLEKESGDAIAILGGINEEPWTFDVQFKRTELGASEMAEFEMTFRAPQDDVQKVVDHAVRLILRSTNTEEGGETAIITLKGRAVSGVCELPKTIEFGSVAKGDTFTQSFEVRNPSQLEATASVGEIYGSDALAFAFTPESPRGSINLPPATNKTVTIAFSPTESRGYLAFVKARASAQCPDYAISLKGTGVDSVLTWAPSPLDFGYVTPGAEVEKELVFTNAGLKDVELSQIKSLSPAEFRIVPGSSLDPTKLTVTGGGGTAKVALSFKPTVLGPRSTQLTFSTSLVRQATGSAQLKGFGGGPEIQVNPSPNLNFGKVAYFAGASTPSYQTRKLSIMNVGTKPAVADPAANLRLGMGGSGTPYYNISALNADSALSEIEILPIAASGPNSYDPAVGLEASAGKNLLDLVVKVTPASASDAGIRKQWEITIYSNDADEPETKVTITADAVILPPCNYSATPVALNFGLVTPPSYRDLTFAVTNLGMNAGETCLMSNLEVAAGSDPSFSLPAGTVAARELMPGETIMVTVRSWPQGQVPATVTSVNGQAQFFMSSPTNPQKLIALSATIANGCLTIAPNDVDFGTVQKGCNSLTRTFSVYNTCTAQVTINSFAMQAAAGQPAGGPDCPGTSPCPEFHLVSTPAIPSGGLVVPSGGVPITFTAKYKPIDFGADSGAIALNVVQGGQAVTYMVTMQGKGDSVGLNTDVYTQDAKPKADILLVIDNSCSMSDDQLALGTNFDSFIKYAVSASVDYHLGVTTTDMNASGARGRLVGDLNNPKVLTQSTFDVQAKFRTKVALGTSGSATEQSAAPALAALTAPLITSDNQGFLRNDAALAVVVVTDAIDQSPQPATFYYNSLMNVKGIKRANMFTYNVIGPFNPNPPSGCYYDGSSDDGRHAYLVGQTNGVKEEICTPDWAKSLEQLGKTAFGFRTNFFLNAVPDLSGGKTITVEINGVTMPQVDSRGSTVWTYDPVANSINFEPMFVPEPGDTLSITYYVTCY